MRYVPLLALCGLAAALQAQSVGVNAGSSATATIAPGAKITVPIVIDLTSAGAVNIAALQSSFTWNALRLTFDSVRVASGLGWTFTPNTTNAASGSVSFSASSASQFPSTGTLANLFFTAGTAGGTRVIPAPSSAANAATQSILAALRVRSLDVCVADAVLYGDANNDATVNIIDAQQIARFTVSLSVLNQTALTDRGDVNADGTVNIIDAQQIARFSVGLSAAARTNTSFIVDPVPTSMVIAPSAAQTVAVGGSVQLNANPQQSSTDVSGCTAVTWQSSDQNVATVTSSGYVTGIAGGVATLTATSVSAPSVQATTSVTVAGSVVTATVSLGQTTLALA
ncbi:MAG TPA: dockerin type I domain-containing protein, partial [Gemmatimonadaceae bacterium]|nr:dockerin type I domain-containing protein [Gemmatimonadaceae bacterium]